MKSLKKLLVLLMAVGVMCLSNVYAENVTNVDEAQINEYGQIENQDGVAQVGDGTYTITDDALLNVVGGLNGETEEETYRDMDIALEDEPVITEEEDNILSILAVISGIGGLLIAGIVLLIIKSKKKTAISK